MIRTPFKVGSIEVSANGNKQLSIPVNLGTITGINFRMMNGATAVSDIAVSKAVLKTIRLEASPKNGMSFDIIKPFSATNLYVRELYYGAARGVTNSAEFPCYDPSAVLFTDEEHRAYLNIGTADLAALNLDFTFGATVTGCTRVDVWVEFDAAIIDYLGAHTRIGSMTTKIPATGGDVVIDNLPKNTDGSFQYQTIHIPVPTNMVLDYITIVSNSNKDIYREVPVSLLQKWQKDCGRTPQTAVVTVDFSKEAFSAYYLSGNMSDFKVTPHFTASGASETQVEVWFELLYLKKG